MLTGRNVPRGRPEGFTVKLITYMCQDRNSLGLNRLGLRDEPALQPQHTLFSSLKKRLPL